MKLAITAAALSVMAVSSVASAQIAYWQFPATAPTQNYAITFPLAADTKANAGAAVITTNASVWNGQTTTDVIGQGAFQYFGGTTLNAVGAATAGQGLGFRGVTSPVVTPPSSPISNGKSMTLQFDTTSFTDIAMSYAERVTGTGPTTIVFAYSTDGTNFTDATTVSLTNRDSIFRVRTVDFSTIAALNNIPAAYIRMTFDGFTSATGAIRFDNIQIVPTPAAAALLGIGGLAAFRRRRA